MSTVAVGMRLRCEVWERYSAAAQRLGVPLSAYLRQRLDDQDRWAEEFAALRVELEHKAATSKPGSVPSFTSGVLVEMLLLLRMMAGPQRSDLAQREVERRKMEDIEERVYRERRGLAPRTLNPEGWTVGDLMRWWLEEYSSRSAAHGSNAGSIRAQILSSPVADKRLEHVRRGDIEALLVAKERDGFSPQTVNHVRAFLVRAFNRAKKADKWLGGNPAEETDTRRVPERIVEILTRDEVLPFFAALVPQQRPVFAAAIMTGLRKGELCGLRKDDVDLLRRLLYVRRCYDRPFPKSKKQRVVRIPEELVPFLEHAVATFAGPWLFPDAEGAMRTNTWQPEDILRRALKRAGIVTGYRHTCRRKGCGHEEPQPDAVPRRCPSCGMKLWPKGQVRRIRFHDLRSYPDRRIIPIRSIRTACAQGARLDRPLAHAG